MPSVIHTTSFIPASAASNIASAAWAGGTKMMEVSAFISSSTSCIVSNTGTPSIVLPPFLGVTPATICVPEFNINLVSSVPTRPVIPWTINLVFSFTSILIVPSPQRSLQLLMCCVLQSHLHLEEYPTLSPGWYR
ncbi:MAG: hypothetical protein C00003105_01375 [ANME-2 cluster archaeon HR1]|nr:MAG: hypothetical protein C00003105_01375 [ANME-2 cluster archaeon HR1]